MGVAGEAGLLLNDGSLLWVVSGNGVAHLTPALPGSRVSPLVTGGFTRLGSGEGGFKAWNVGVGADVWLKPHAGLRVEIRDHVRPDSRGSVHYWAVRAGVVFR